MILPDLNRHQNADRIFLAVHHPLPESGNGIAPVHVHRVGAELSEGIDKNWAAHYSQPQTLDIGRRADGQFAVGHLTESVFGPGQPHQTFGVHGLKDRFAGFTVFHFVEIFKIVDEKRQGEDVGFCDDGRYVDGRFHGTVDHPVGDQLG